MTLSTFPTTRSNYPRHGASSVWIFSASSKANQITNWRWIYKSIRLCKPPRHQRRFRVFWQLAELLCKVLHHRRSVQNVNGARHHQSFFGNSLFWHSLSARYEWTPRTRIANKLLHGAGEIVVRFRLSKFQGATERWTHHRQTKGRAHCNTFHRQTMTPCNFFERLSETWWNVSDVDLGGIESLWCLWFQMVGDKNLPGKIFSVSFRVLCVLCAFSEFFRSAHIIRPYELVDVYRN